MNTRSHSMNTISIVIIVGIFAVSSVMLALLGVHVYKSTISNSQSQTMNETSMYFVTKVRQCEDKSRIRTATVNGEIPALVIGHTSNGIDSETWLYVHNGALRESIVKDAKEVDPLHSKAIMAMKSADYEIVDGNLLQVTINYDNNTQSIINVNLPGGSGND